MENKKELIPGVPFETIDKTNFYVDVLWAIVLESRENLNNIVDLKKERRDVVLEKLLREPIMQKTYAIWWYFVQKKTNPKSFKASSRLTKLYYGPISHALVPLQLDHKYINDLTKVIVNIVAIIITKTYRVKEFKNDQEFYTAKLSLAKEKQDLFGINNESFNEYIEDLNIKVK